MFDDNGSSSTHHEANYSGPLRLRFGADASVPDFRDVRLGIPSLQCINIKIKVLVQMHLCHSSRGMWLGITANSVTCHSCRGM